MAPLHPCLHCRRHVVVSESSCPFCGTALARPTIRYVGRLPRATRGALMTIGAIAIASCGSEVVVYDDPPSDDDGTTSGAVTTSSGGIGGGNVGGMGGDIGVDLYGAPSTGGMGGSAMGGGGAGGTGGENGNQGGGLPLYGAAPFPDDDDSL